MKAALRLGAAVVLLTCVRIPSAYAGGAALKFHGIPVERDANDPLVQLLIAGEAVTGLQAQRQPSGPGASSVVELNVETHNQFLKNSSNAVVLYYVPWCHWCNKFLPIYDELAGLADVVLAPLQAGKLSFAKIDLNRRENKPIMEQQKILSYPSLKLHREGGNSVASFEGEHELQPVLRWLTELTTAKIEITRPDQLEALLKFRHSDVVVVLVNPAKEMEAAFYAAQNDSRMQHVMFGITRNPEVSDYILHTFEAADPATTDDRTRVTELRKSPHLPYLALLNPHYYSDDVDKFVYDQSHLEYLAHIFPEKTGHDKLLTSVSEIQKFISSYQFPTVARWSMSVAQKLLESGRSFIVTFMHLNDTIAERQIEEEKQALNGADSRLLYVEDVLWSVGRQHRHQVVTVLSGLTRFHERRLMATLNVETTPNLYFVTMNPTGSGVFAPMLRYIAPKDVQDTVFSTVDDKGRGNDPKRAALAVGNWINRIFEGKVDPDVKSEEVPPEDIQGPVRVVVGRTFDREVVRSGKDVVVDFHAPWCGHCRVFAPIYERVAKAFKKAGIPTIQFTKMDATANEVPGLHLRGYPTILLYPGADKQHPILNMAGNQNEASIVDWLASQVHFKFDPVRVHQALDSFSEDDDLPKLIDEL